MDNKNIPLREYKIEYLLLVPEENIDLTKELFDDLKKLGNLKKKETKGFEVEGMIQNIDFYMKGHIFQNLRCFLIQLISDNSDGLLHEQIIEIEGRLSSHGLKVLCIRDDLGEEYAKQAFEYLYEIENSLRKLILLKMLKVHGLTWWEDRIPKNTKDKFSKNKSKDEMSKKLLSELHFIDFSHLEGIIKFDASQNPEFFKTSVLGCNDYSELKKQFKKSSNWENIFQKVFGNEENLKKITTLISLRNQIAHTRRFSREEIEKIQEEFKFLKELLENIVL